MPEERVRKRAQAAKAQGKSASTQAGEFVREEIHHVREGKHGARSPQQAIAIGLSKARRAGVKLPPPKAGQASEETRQSAKRDYRKGQKASHKQPAARRSRATTAALRREGEDRGEPAGALHRDPPAVLGADGAKGEGIERREGQTPEEEGPRALGRGNPR